MSVLPLVRFALRQLGIFTAVATYLVTLHRAPWPTFWAQSLLVFGLSLLFISWWLSGKARESALLGPLPLVLLGLATLPWLQSNFGLLALPQEGLWLAALLVVCALLSLAASSSHESARSVRAQDLWWVLLIAGGLTALACLVQWTGWHGLGALLEDPPPGGRSMGNVGQPNLASTLIVWALLAAIQLAHRQRVWARAWPIWCGFLLLGLITTQSRTGLLQLGLLTLSAWLAPHNWGLRHWRWRLSALLVVTLGLALAWPLLNEVLERGPKLGLEDRLASGKRPAIWRLGWLASLERPWLGWGWYQGVVAHLALAGQDPSIKIPIAGFHNLALDLVVWLGWPVGISLMGGIGWSLVCMQRRTATQADAALMLGVLVFLVHAALELPHLELHFLLPALLMATWHPAATGRAWPHVSGRWVLLLLGLLIGFSALLARDYAQREQEVFVQRMLAARILVSPQELAHRPADGLGLLRHLDAQLAAQRALLEGRTPPPEELQRLVQRYPSPANLSAWMRHLLERGRLEELEVWRLRACALYQPPECEAIAADAKLPLTP